MGLLFFHESLVIRLDKIIDIQIFPMSAAFFLYPWVEFVIKDYFTALWLA